MVPYNGDILDEVPSHVPHHIVKVVVMHITARLPEADIPVGRGILGVRFEGVDFSMCKLGEKPRVFGPEQADIGNGEENHSDTFETKAKSPTHFVCDAYNTISARSRQTLPKWYLRGQVSIAAQRHNQESQAIFHGRRPRLHNWGS